MLMTNTIATVWIALWIAVAACQRPPPAAAEPAAAGSDDTAAKKGDSVIDEAKARQLALDELRKRGKDPARYDVTVQDTATEWAVDLVGKQPRPPGDELMVYVSKATGTLRVMQGE
jgi:hypothetical protein